jgi:putative ABC transport system permease protein
MDLRPKAVTAAMIGLKSRLAAFKLQRFVNEYPEEALTAILPGVALQELWGLVGVAETALGAVSAMVVATALLGMVTMVLATLGERRREMAILRAVGARPAHVLGLLAVEAGLLALAGTVLGTALLYAALAALRPLIDARFGLWLEIAPPTSGEFAMLASVVLAGLLAGLLPAWRAYRLSLSDGMTVRI